MSIPMCYATVGLLLGLVAIHPATMLMNHHMTGPPHHPDGWVTTVVEALRGAFTTARGWVWGSGYALLCAFIGFLLGALKTRELALRAANAELASEKDRSDGLLLNVLPKDVADQLKESGRSIPQKFEDVTILFSDIVGFSRIAEGLSPELLINELNELFTGFDNIMDANGCERVKTIGDAYLAVSGMPKEDPDHASNIIKAALEMVAFLDSRNRVSDITWEVRVGVHSGEVVGGVVGIKKYIYDIFGDTINCAARLQQHSEPMRINVSDATLEQLGDEFPWVERGLVETKEGRALRMHYIGSGPGIASGDGA